MRVKSELLLYRLSWTVDIMLSPTWRNMNDSFESWAYRNGCLRQIQTLEAQRFVESRKEPRTDKDRVYRLTELGRRAALGGRDPESEWSRAWAGQWGLVMFDVPEAERHTRGLVRKTLRRLHFGCLQMSVWISPDPLSQIASELKQVQVEASSLVLMEARTCAGESPPDLVGAAWDFKRINRAWETLERHLALAPGKTSGKEALLKWSETEYDLWRTCMSLDPLLPKALHPGDYQGVRIWKLRQNVLAALGRLLVGTTRTSRKPA